MSNPIAALIMLFARRWKLSLREAEVVEHSAGGLRNKQIAAVMGCSEKTVETYWRRIFTKSGHSGKEEILATLLRLAITHTYAPVEPMPAQVHGEWDGE